MRGNNPGAPTHLGSCVVAPKAAAVNPTDDFVDGHARRRATNCYVVLTPKRPTALLRAVLQVSPPSLRRLKWFCRKVPATSSPPYRQMNMLAFQDSQSPKLRTRQVAASSTSPRPAESATQLKLFHRARCWNGPATCIRTRDRKGSHVYAIFFDQRTKTPLSRWPQIRHFGYRRDTPSVTERWHLVCKSDGSL